MNVYYHEKKRKDVVKTTSLRKNQLHRRHWLSIAAMAGLESQKNEGNMGVWRLFIILLHNNLH